jgi:guanylate kinase
MTLSRSGQLFILSAPSGGGKTTLCRAVLKHFPDMLYSVSFTTRSPRGDEKDGRDYFFITKDEFEKGIASGRWVEWAKVHGNYYGTEARFLNDNLAAGRDILLDIDVEGTRQVLQRYPDCIAIFILPPSLEVLKQRLESRGTENDQSLALRIQNAAQEIAQKDIYRHQLVNDRLADTVAELISLIESYRNEN